MSPAQLEESSAMEREESREVPLPPAAQLHALLQPHTQAEADVSPFLLYLASATADHQDPCGAHGSHAQARWQWAAAPLQMAS